MPEKAFSSVGFFHFGKDHHDPMGALEAAIDKSTLNLEDALVVLPEGFSLGRYYEEDLPADFDMSVLCKLARTSEETHCAFVASVVVRSTPGMADPPFSTAYLVDGKSKIQPLTRKALVDTTTASPKRKHPNYTPYDSLDSFPMVHRGLGLAVLICRDALDWDQHDRDLFTKFLDAFSKLEARHHVMCIPANTKMWFRGLTTGCKATNGMRWPDSTINIFANSNREHFSFVSGNDGTILTPDVRGPLNHIETVLLEKFAPSDPIR